MLEHEGGECVIGAWRLVGDISEIVDELEESRKSKSATGITGIGHFRS